MKSILLASALLLATLTSKTFAADVKITPLLEQAFKTSFHDASDAQWSVVNHLYRVEFTSGGDKVIAFFNGDGTLVATSRYITLENLPYELKSNLVRRTVTGSIQEVFEVKNSEDQIDYFATVNQDTKQVVLKSSGATWNVYKKK